MRPLDCDHDKTCRNWLVRMGMRSRRSQISKYRARKTNGSASRSPDSAPKRSRLNFLEFQLGDFANLVANIANQGKPGGFEKLADGLGVVLHERLFE